MRNSFKEKKFFVYALLIYLSGVIAYAYMEYHHVRGKLQAELDQRLLLAVSSAEAVMHGTLGDNITGIRQIGLEDEYGLALVLKSLVDRMRVFYIYCTIERDGKIHFISSSPEPHETSIDNYKSVFLSEYYDAPASLYESFEQNTVKFSEYKDHWGIFRSVFVPFKTSNDQTYVIGVDVKIEHIIAASRESTLAALLGSLIMALLIVPVMISYLRTLRRHYREQLISAQTHQLSGLPNKRFLESELNRHEENQLILINVENIKAITNVIGIAGADSLVLKITYHLQQALSCEQTGFGVYHLDDDQFALYCHEPVSKDYLEQLAATVFRGLSQLQLEHANNPMPLLVRMGIVYNQPNTYVLASMAISHAKSTNKSRVVYDSSLNLPDYFKDYIRTLNHLTDAFNNDRVMVLYQPIIDARSLKVVKYEALARIIDHDGSVICSPIQFMPVAYQSRLCNKITRVVLDKVIGDLEHTDNIVSINLSVKDLFDQKTRDYIIDRIDRAGVRHKIEFELLEQQAIQNYPKAAKYLTELRGHCHAIGMDDLGKLYSNFDRLLNLPLDFVKIDGIIVQAIKNSSEATVLVEGIVNYARTKGIKVIAEYCSSESICFMVTRLGVDMLQGFYFGEPARNNSFNI
ncbi:MAG: GGDEF domain-containing protein [bacterium]|nr:GGDEF domain-containing protein [bacterium]